MLSSPGYHKKKSIKRKLQLKEMMNIVFTCIASEMKPATLPVVPNWIRSWTSFAYFSPSEPKTPLYGSGFKA